MEPASNSLAKALASVRDAASEVLGQLRPAGVLILGGCQGLDPLLAPWLELLVRQVLDRSELSGW